MNKAQKPAESSPFDREFYSLSSQVRSSFKVSPYSVWPDPLWQFDNRTPGSSKYRASISWDKVVGSDELIEDCRLFVFSLLTENMRGRALNPVNLVELGPTLRSFLKWMESLGIERFSQIPEHFGEHYFEYVMSLDGAEKWSTQSIGKYLDLPVKIYEQSPVLLAAGRDGIKYHPFGGLNPYVVAKQQGVESDAIPPVPDELFLAITTEVFNWVEDYSADIIRAIDIAVRAREYGVQYENWRAKDVNKALKKFQFSGGDSPWHKPFGLKPTFELRELLSDLRIACVIAIQAFVGMRINELLSLEADPVDETTGLPHCVVMRPSRNGLLDVFYIRGTLTKGQDEPATVEWVAGARPAGSKHIPPPVKAIMVLEELFREWRTNAVTRLVLTPPGYGGMPDFTEVHPASNKLIDREQAEFVDKFIYAKNPDLAKEMQNWRVSSHQWRKSFAQYVVRSDNSLLRAVSEHFKHVSLAMTSEDYIGNDVELLELLDDEGLQRAAEIMVDLTTGTTYGAGIFAQLLGDRKEYIQELIGDGTREEKIQTIKDELREDNIRSWACGWGDCVFRPETARCQYEVNSDVDYRVSRPNTTTRRPSLCCDCANLVVLKEHEPFWKNRMNKNEEIIAAENDANSPASRTAHSRVQQCLKILRKLKMAQGRKNAH